MLLFSLLLCFKTTTWSTTKIQSCVPSPEVQERLLLCLPSVCQRLHESVPAAESFCSKTKKAASAVTAFMTSQLKVLECPPCRTAAIGLCWPHWWHALLDWYPLLLGMLSLALWEAFGWSARNFCTRQCYGLQGFVFQIFCNFICRKDSY